jgi:hypothetical protein
MKRYNLQKIVSKCTPKCLYSAYLKWKYLKGAPFGQAVARIANIRIGWKGLVGTNAPAYLESFVSDEEKSFMGLKTGQLHHPVESSGQCLVSFTKIILKEKAQN